MHIFQHLMGAFQNRELDELYASMAFRSFALGMISIFVPIYLINLGYPLATILFFYALINLFHAMMVIPATKLASKFGFKHAIFFSTPLLILFYIMLYSLESLPFPLPVIALVYGLNNALFWVGYHVDFTKFSDEKNRGKQVGTARLITSIFQAAGPIIGGLLLTVVSFKVIFSIVSVLIIFSAIPLFFSRDIHDPINFSVRQIFADQKARDYAVFAGYGIESGVGLVIWPVIIFLSIISNYAVLGSITSVTLPLSLAFTFMAGRLCNRKPRILMKISSFATTIIWAVKTAIRTTLQVFVVDAFYGVSKIAMNMSFSTLSYNKADRGDAVEFVAFREIIIQLGRVVLFLVMIFVSNLKISLVLASLASLLFLFF